jgi:hypothetical protein
VPRRKDDPVRVVGEEQPPEFVFVAQAGLAGGLPDDGDVEFAGSQAPQHRGRLELLERDLHVRVRRLEAGERLRHERGAGAEERAHANGPREEAGQRA